jgi:hypothetical protein
METPFFYRDDKERLTEVQGRVDMRKVAAIVAFLERHIGYVPETRSETLRTIVDLLFESVVKKDPSVAFTLNKDAYAFLKTHGLGMKRGARDRQRFERHVLGSEAFDIEHMGGTQDQVALYEEAVSLFSGLIKFGRTYEQAVKAIKNFCELKGIMLDVVLDRVHGGLKPSTGKPDHSRIIDSDVLRDRRATGAGVEPTRSEVMADQDVRELQARRAMEEEDTLAKMRAMLSSKPSSSKPKV